MQLNLNQVTIPVSNVEESMVFYQKLGLRLIVKALPKYARFECESGDTTFSLHQSTEGSGGVGAWIYFETATLDADVERLVASGLIFESMPEDQPWLWREARLRDPDGNLLILYAAGENRKNPAWRLGATQ